MTVPILLPQLGFSMEEGKLVEWLVEDGADVAEGAPIYSLEGDKAVQDVEAPATGRLRVIVSADAIYPVGALLGEIE